jgi:hypothetical protein
MESKEIGDTYERECVYCEEVKTFIVQEGDLPGHTTDRCEDWEGHPPLFGE